MTWNDVYFIVLGFPGNQHCSNFIIYVLCGDLLGVIFLLLLHSGFIKCGGTISPGKLRILDKVEKPFKAWNAIWSIEVWNVIMIQFKRCYLDFKISALIWSPSNDPGNSVVFRNVHFQNQLNWTQSFSKKFPTCDGSESWSPHSQHPIMVSCPEPDDFSPCTHTLLPWLVPKLSYHLNLDLASSLFHSYFPP